MRNLFFGFLWSICTTIVNRILIGTTISGFGGAGQYGFSADIFTTSSSIEEIGNIGAMR